MAYLIPDHLIGKMPCMWCGRIVTMPSMDGPGVCSLCDMGIKIDTQLAEIRKWRPDDPEMKRYMSGQPHEAFLFALWEGKV